MQVNVIPMPSPPRVVDGDQLRVELREQLAAAASAAEAVEAAKAAVHRAWKASKGAEKVISELEDALEDAQADHAANLSEAHKADLPPPAPAQVRSARQAVADAREDAQAHEAAHKNLKAELPTLQAAARDAETQAEQIISQILAGPAEHLVAQCEEAVRKLQPIAFALRR